MTVERRVKMLEQRLGLTADIGRLVLVTPNSWGDADRDAWERAEILRDTTVKDDLVEKYSGIRPTRCPGRVSVVIVPAPAAVEESSEEERAAWRARWT